MGDARKRGSLLENETCDVCGKTWFRRLQAQPYHHSPDEYAAAAVARIHAKMLGYRR